MPAAALAFVLLLAGASFVVLVVATATAVVVFASGTILTQAGGLTGSDIRCQEDVLQRLN